MKTVGVGRSFSPPRSRCRCLEEELLIRIRAGGPKPDAFDLKTMLTPGN